MTADSPLDPFDDDVLGQVAAANDVEPDALKDAVADHQRTMRTNPGVENLVYEWRKQYDEAVVARTPDLFVVAVAPTVWEEYGDYLDIDVDLFAALTAVHAEQTMRSDDVSATEMPPDRAPVVVGRT